MFVPLATATMSPKENGRVGVMYLVFTAVANATCTLLGLLLCVAIKPGKTSEQILVLNRVQQ